MRRLGALAVAAGLSLLVIDGPASAAEFKSTEARKAATDYDTAVRAVKNGFLQELAKARQAGERRKAAAADPVAREALQKECDLLAAELVRLRDEIKSRGEEGKTITVVVPANVPWTTVGPVVAGATVHFKATGKWKGFAKWYGPEGIGGKQFYLRGSIGKEVFKIGAEATVTVRAAGTLALGMADEAPKDNSGELTVVVTLLPPPTVVSQLKSEEAVKACRDYEATLKSEMTKYALALTKARETLAAKVAAAPDAVLKEGFQKELDAVTAELNRLPMDVRPAPAATPEAEEMP